MEKPQVFTDEDMAVMRAALAETRTTSAYAEGKYNVSKFNRDEKIVGKMPKSVILRDISLRTMEQMSGVVPSYEQRMELLRAIAATGVGSIEPSTFRRGHDDHMKAEADAIREINPNCEIIYGAVSSEDEIKLAADTGYDGVEIWTSFLGGAQPSCAGAVYHRAWQGRDWHDLNFPKVPQDQIDRTLRYVELGKKHGVHVLGSINLAALMTEEYVYEYFKQVSEAGSPEITFADGSSGLGPEAIAHLVRIAKEAAPNVKIGVHCHDGFGLGMACAVEAVKAGASLVEVAVNQLEEHVGQPDLAVAAACFEAVYGVDTGIKMETLFPLARLAEKISGYELQWNHPVTGKFVYDQSAGDEYVQEDHVDPLIHNAITPDWVGGWKHGGLGVTTGPFTMWDKLVEIGFDVQSKEQVNKILEQVKQTARDGDGHVSDDQVRTIANSVSA